MSTQSKDTGKTPTRKPDQEYRYAVAACVSMVLSLTAIVVFNSILDPYGLTQWVKISGLNAKKPAAPYHERARRAFEIRHFEPTSAAFGTSRLAYGIPMDSPLWAGESRRNLGMAGATIYQTLRAFELAASQGSLKRAMIGLDFFAFNIHRKPYNGFREILFEPHIPTPLLLASEYASYESILDTVKMMGLQHGGPDLYVADGGYSQEEILEFWEKEGGTRRLFRRQGKGFMAHEYFVIPTYLFALSDGNSSSFDHFRRLLRIAKKNNIETRLFFSPEHAWILEATRMAGLTESFFLWKRELVKIAAEEGFSGILDFQKINDITTENIPLAEAESRSKMTWWWDGSHYTQKYGRLIVDRVWSNDDKFDDLSSNITPGNVDESLQVLMAGLNQYERNHPEEVIELKNIRSQIHK